MRLFAWGLSDVGRKRDHNEDSYLVQSPLAALAAEPGAARGSGLFAVADGMGGHQAGERASRMAIDILGREVASVDGNGEVAKDAGRLVREAAQRAGAAIFDAAQGDAEMAGMGTTLTALLVHRGRGYLAHVGDSRCYLFRDGRCQQLTEDHSWVSEQVRAGLLSEAEARESKFKHIITRSVGFERDVQIDSTTLAIEPGDCFLLCSDGLSNYLEGDEIAKLLTARFYRQVPPLLIGLANDRGGEDNVTVVLVHAANDAG